MRGFMAVEPLKRCIVKNEDYRSILGRLPIKSPTVQDMAMLCPHLTTEEAVNAFMADSGYVACPPLLIRNSFQIVSYHKEWVEQIPGWKVVDGKEIRVIIGTKNHPAILQRERAGRTLESYTDGQLHGDIIETYKHMDKAMKFAEDNWGDELILDNWASVAYIYVQDPTDLVNDRYHHNYPRTKAVLYVALNRDINEIAHDHTKPETEVLDEAISQITLDHVVWSEIVGGRGGFTEYSCANCGAGLLLSSCSGCGHKFRDDYFRSGGYTPLSRKMVAFLRENGHEFRVDPEIAWKKERQRWER